jgi:hypothetical protein
MHIDCKINFHHYVDLFSRALKLLELIRTITFSLSTLDILLMLYIIRSNLNSNVFLLVGILLRLLTPINLSAYIEHLQPFATIYFSKVRNITIIIYWKD